MDRFSFTPCGQLSRLVKMTPVNLTKKKRCMRKQTLRPFFHVRFFYIPIFMIGKNFGAAAATPAASVPTPMQFYAVFLKSVM